MVNPKASELMKNRALYKKCEKTYKWIFGIYALFCLAFVVTSFSACFNPLGFGQFALIFFDGVICKCAMFVSGYIGAYKKNDRFAILAPCILLLNSLLFMYAVNFGMLLISAAIAAVNVMTDKKYHILEEQEGFPYFNESLLEQEQHIKQQKIKDDYTINYERLKKSSADSMETVNLSTLSEAESSDESGYMDIL